MSKTGAIWAALDTYLANTSGAPTIVFGNMPPQEVSSASTFWEAIFRPTSRRPVVIGDGPEQVYQGLYEIRVCVPKNEGNATARDMAETLEDRFAPHSRIQGVDVVVDVEYSETQFGFSLGPFYCVPVLVGWRANAE